MKLKVCLRLHALLWAALLAAKQGTRPLPAVQLKEWYRASSLTVGGKGVAVHLGQEAAAGRACFRRFLQQRRHCWGVDVHKQALGQPDRRHLHRTAPEMKSSYS